MIKEDILAGQAVLVTGAAGFIGSNLVRRLIEVGSCVYAMVRPSSDQWRLGEILDRLELVRCDISNFEVAKVASALSRVRIIYHLAAAGVQPANQDAGSLIETNVGGTLRVLQLGRALGVDRFIYIGSCFEYGSGSMLSEEAVPLPASEYGASKAAGWMLARTFFWRYGLPVVSLRPFTVYGPFEGGHRLIPYTILRALRGSAIELTEGEQVRDFVFVHDAIEAFLLAATVPEAPGGTFNVCTGAPRSVKEVASLVVQRIGGGARLAFGARPHRDTEAARLSGDPSRSQAILGWRARTAIADGLAYTIEWFQENRHRFRAYRRLSEEHDKS